MKTFELYDFYETVYGSGLPLEEKVFNLYLPLLLKNVGLQNTISPKAKQTLPVQKEEDKYYITLPTELSRILQVYNREEDIRLNQSTVKQHKGTLGNSFYLPFRSTKLYVDRDHKELEVTYSTNPKDVSILEIPDDAEMHTVIAAGLHYFNRLHLWTTQGVGTAQQVMETKEIYDRIRLSYINDNRMTDIKITHNNENI